MPRIRPEFSIWHSDEQDKQFDKHDCRYIGRINRRGPDESHIDPVELTGLPNFACDSALHNESLRQKIL